METKQQNSIFQQNTQKQQKIIKRLFSVGSGSSGLLLAGHLDDQYILQEQNIYDEKINFQNDSQINEIQFDGMMGVAVDYSKNTVYKFGECYISEQNKKEVQFKPNIVNFTPKIQITDISCGWNHCIFYNKNDIQNIFGFGSNSFGELGLGSKNKNFFQETQILKLNIENQKIKNNQQNLSIILGKCGFRQTYILLNNQDLYVCGQNKSFELGIEKKSDQYQKGVIFEFVKNNNQNFIQTQDIQNIKLGYKFGGVQNTKGEVFLWGDNKYLQVSSQIQEKTIEKLVKLDDNIEKFDLGWNHVIYKKKGIDNIFMQGRNDMGQIGSQDKQLKQNIIKFDENIGMEEQENIIDIAAGSECSYVLTDNQKLYAWGWNEHGNLGNGNQENLYLPQVIKYDNSQEKDGKINKVMSKGATMYLISEQLVKQ